MKRTSLIFITIILTALLGVAILVSADGHASNSHQVVSNQTATSQASTITIDNFSFVPTTVTVAAGTTVTWTNSDDVPHTIVSDNKIFKSKVLDTDEKFSYMFTKPGTYPYFCSVHPKMTANIVVQ